MDTTRGAGASRATAWAGIVAAVLYAGGVITMLAGSPDDKHHKDPVKFAADYTKYFDDSGKRAVAIVGAYVVMLACIAMVVFALHLRDRLAASGASGAGRLTFAGAILFAALTMVGALAYAWVPGSVAFGNVPVPKGELAYMAPQLAFGFLLVGGMAAAALMLIAGGAAAARSEALPKWLGWSGVVVGVIVFLTGAFFMPVLLFVLWVLVAAIVCLRRPMPATA